MTDVAATSRGRRGRVLVLGDGPLADTVVERCAVAPVRVRNLYEAIGELAASDVRHPIVAALLPDEHLPSPPGRAAGALRRIDPAVRLIRVTPDATALRADTGAFDDCVPAPVEVESLLALLAEEVEIIDACAVATPAARDGANGSTSPTVVETAPRPREPIPAAPRAEPAPRPRPDLPEGDTKHAPREPAPPLPATEATGATDEPPRDLGDVNLLDAVMTDPDGVRDTALSLIRQQTGWNDVRLLAPDAEAEEGTVTADVRVGGACRGRLASRATRAEYLGPWGEWLGRWLALDDSYRAYRELAYRDDLTGAWNRRYFHRFLTDVLPEAARRRRPVTVMVFDIDDFKHYNDVYAHEAGDEILRETVALMNSVIRHSDRVCRIGGDEFAVVFADLEGPREPGSSHPDSVELIARRFQAQISALRFPKLGPEAPGPLTISAGLATFPWDTHDPEALLRIADERAMESKRKGKNSITYGSG